MPDESKPIVFMGTPEFAAVTLQALLDRNFPVRAVVTQPDRPKGRGQELAKPPVKVLAEAHRIPVVQPEKIRTAEFETWLREQNPYFLVVVAYGRILPKNILELPPGGCINGHASLLPRWRGASPIQWSIVNGDRETGITTMMMDEGLDTGPMLLKRALPIGADEDAASLHDRLAALGGELMCETLERLTSGAVQPTPQPADGVTFAPILKKEDGAVAWDRPAQEIHDLVRGLTPWPGAYTHFRGQYLKIIRTRMPSLQKDGAPGEVIDVAGPTALVSAGEGAVELHEVQPAGKKRMSAGDFFRGARLQPGERLGTMNTETAGSAANGRK
jgi:methionyl-tRNA formyltransferase